jgi:uncharacterized protein (DUF983 family)
MTLAAHTFSRSIARGISQRCPNCGRGKLFSRYLKVEPRCRECGCDLSQFRADDGPAYLTILLVGHLLVAPSLIFPIVWQRPELSLPVMIPALTVTTLALLSIVKGGWVGLMYAIDASNRADDRPAPEAAE